MNKESMIEDLIKVQNEFALVHPGEIVTRQYYINHGKYKKSSIGSVFGSFTEFKSFIPSEIVASTEDSECVRSKLHKVYNEAPCSGKKTYFVTAVIPDAPVVPGFFKTICNYHKYTSAKKVFLPMRGVSVLDHSYAPEIEAEEENIYSEFVFNTNCKAQDFLINPQMKDPLTALDTYGQKEYSLIIASPKQRLKSIPISQENLSHLIQSTGTCTTPTYAYTRWGRIAKQDHCTGGLIVEIENDKIFHIRQVQADKYDGGFYDLGTYYSPNKPPLKKRASAIVLGDIHCGFESATAIKSWKECIELTNPKFIIMHDVFDGHSISHHDDHDIEAQVNRKESINTLEKELDNLANTLNQWCTDYPDKEIVVVRSNHDKFLDRYLKEGRYITDRWNHKLALHLASWLLDGLNPLEEYVKSKFKLKNIKWLKDDKDYTIHGIHIGSHGDKSYNGAKGSAKAIELAYGNSVTGHTHTPQILGDCWIVGTSTDLKLKYNKSSPSSWLHASCLIYPNGQRQMIISVNGSWKN